MAWRRNELDLSDFYTDARHDARAGTCTGCTVDEAAVASFYAGLECAHPQSRRRLEQRACPHLSYENFWKRMKFMEEDGVSPVDYHCRTANGDEAECNRRVLQRSGNIGDAWGDGTFLQCFYDKYAGKCIGTKSYCQQWAADTVCWSGKCMTPSNCAPPPSPPPPPSSPPSPPLVVLTVTLAPVLPADALSDACDELHPLLPSSVTVVPNNGLTSCDLQSIVLHHGLITPIGHCACNCMLQTELGTHCQALARMWS